MNVRLELKGFSSTFFILRTQSLDFDLKETFFCLAHLVFPLRPHWRPTFSFFNFSPLLFVSTFFSCSLFSCSSSSWGKSSFSLDVNFELEIHSYWSLNFAPWSVPHPSLSLSSLHPNPSTSCRPTSYSNPPQRKRHYWRLDCKCIILFQNNTTNKYYKVTINYSMKIHNLSSFVWSVHPFLKIVVSSCRRSLCLRSWRCALLETSLSCPQARILTASSSSLALCATLLGRTPTPSLLCPPAIPRLSPRPLPPPAK